LIGKVLNFVSSGAGTGNYVIRENVSRGRIFSNFEESKFIKPATSSTDSSMGTLLVSRLMLKCLFFNDWSSELDHKVNVSPEIKYSSHSGN